MWNGLFFGLVNLFAPQAALPDAVTIKHEIQQFAQVYEIDTDRIHVRESAIENPSPFVTNSGTKACILHVNQTSEARRMWSYFIETGHRGMEPAFITFTAGHEMTHCLMSEKGKRAETRTALENYLGITFNNNTHFEETLADLVGLAYVAQTVPESFAVVYKRVKEMRTDFSKRDPLHDSSNAIRPDSIEWAHARIKRPDKIASTSGS